MSTQPFIISRVFDAPRELVFLVNTDPVHLAQWMGPTGTTTIQSKMDLRVGGTHHYGLRTPDGGEVWGKQVFQAIEIPSKLVYIQSFSDKDGKITAHPMAPTWPLEMMTIATFEDAGQGKCKMTINWVPHNADAVGEATFDAAREGMVQGWGGSFAKLDEHLAATEKQLINSRWVQAPRELVWKAFTDPAHVNAWWGPDGFKNVDVEQEVKVGGVWKYVMVGPDGTRYKNKITYTEIKAPERLAYDHGDWESVHFQGHVTLTEEAGGTRVIATLICPTKKFRDGVCSYAIEGGRQHLGNLAAYVAGMQGGK